MQLEIISPDKSLFKGQADYISCPGTDGSFGILNNHAPIIATLKAGQLLVRDGGSEQTFEINGGVVEVLSNKVIVLAE